MRLIFIRGFSSTSYFKINFLKHFKVERMPLFFFFFYFCRGEGRYVLESSVLLLSRIAFYFVFHYGYHYVLHFTQSYVN